VHQAHHLAWQEIHFRADRAAGAALVALEARPGRSAAPPLDLVEETAVIPLDSSCHGYVIK
jgi:hypothetical protein